MPETSEVLRRTKDEKPPRRLPKARRTKCSRGSTWCSLWPMRIHPARHTIEGNLVVKETVHEQSDRGEDGNSEKRDEMRKVVAVTQMTLDGVMQALSGPEEDPSG